MSSTTSTKSKRKYPRCANGTRRHKKTRQCRSKTHTKCKKGTRRSRKNGKCDLK